MRIDLPVTEGIEYAGSGEFLITEWFKKVGNVVKKNEGLFFYASDKVEGLEYLSPADGTLVEIFIPRDGKGEKGQSAGTIETGSVLAGEPEKTVVAPAVPKDQVAALTEGSRPKATPLAKKITEGVGIDLATVKGTGPLGKITEDDVRREIERRATAAPKPQPTPLDTPGAPKASPMARVRAKDLGIDLSLVPGTGPDGVITEKDLGNYLISRGQAQTAPKPARLPEPPRDPFEGREDPRGTPRVTVLTPLQVAVARNLSKSNNVSTAVSHDLVRLKRIVEYRKANADAFLKATGVKLRYDVFLIKAAVEALKAFPKFNAMCVDEGGEMKLFAYERLNIGFAMDVDYNLRVPAIFDAGQKSLEEIAKSLDDVVIRAKAKKLTIKNLTGITFTINNTGAANALTGVPILPPDTVGILEMGRIEEMLWISADGRTVEIAPGAWLTLVFDHRPINGRYAIEFLQKIRSLLENPTFL